MFPGSLAADSRVDHCNKNSERRLGIFLPALQQDESGHEGTADRVVTRLLGAERDDLTPVQHHAERLAKALAPKAEYVLIKGAGHFSFIASFPDALRNSVGEAGQDPSGFDRNAMHESLNFEIVAFFNRTLK